MIKKEKLNEISIVRAIAILGVLFVHSTSFITVELPTVSRSYVFYNFLNTFFKYGTPTFIFLSSFVLFYNYANREITKKMLLNFYRRRLLYIVVPYLIFSVFYFALTVHLYYDYTLTEALTIFTQKVLTGKAYTHLYFVFISIQLYLIFPLVLYLVQKYKWVSKYAILIGLVIQWTFVILNHYFFHITFKGSISLSYMAYYFLGIYLGVHFEQFRTYLKSNKRHLISALWLISGILYVYVMYLTRKGLATYDSLVYEFFWNVFTYFAAVFYFGFAFTIYDKLNVGLRKALLYLGDISFGVYLIHPFFLLYYRMIGIDPQSPWYHLFNLGLFLSGLIFSIITVELITRYFKYSWILFGTVRKEPGKQK
ncbi:acyltransferase [Ureibacillus aquaedulcis]|uniref:Acyltransferase n=1 Tax=Ureibacillus aquaedulcis TaxID=3058421 RepID=A0ABT8GQQ5_9BACL|nr:acyltransferase [Ureibacillus sp. BA0131]MDN4493746.1 acyltransferase [Ureibacillus sp. BA0131]